ncbi:MAG: enoyl-CoA hydratase/isomerase family protein [Solirubrobacteraceae bacterium]|nr:enoyl-CoA hydratase/isomerase family protein [Solirubrobacteraceae bacterium]
MSTEYFRWEQDADGIVVVTMDAPGKSANTMGLDYQEAMGELLDRLDGEIKNGAISGLVIASAKKTFFAGGDLDGLRRVRPDDAIHFATMIDLVKTQLRRLETLGIPVVAAINGAALGGGLEIALACHHRVVVDDPSAKLGLPEVTLGLLPGAGGVTRTVRMLGIAEALMKVLIKGDRMVPAKALKVGIVDELVATREELVPAAKAWIKANPDATKQPWDRDGYKIPGGTPASPKLAAMLPAIPANITKQLKGANYPAPKAIAAAAVEGSQVDFDLAWRIETRYLTELVTGQVAKNMIQAFFFDLAEAGGLRGRPEGVERWQATKVVVLGAGMMGAAIAYVSAKAGIEVVLKDVSQEAADRGKAYSEGLVAKAVERGRMTQEKADALLARITPTTDPVAAAGADLVIEAVFEDPAVKAQVMAEIEPYLDPAALLGSNTSTLPITGLAANVSRPADFIGLHFFSPVDKMPLLEIIKGEQTSDDALHRALDFAKQISKTPIVVNDSRGFFTSRVIGTFINEGIAMLVEGVPAPSIEQASSQAGYPAPVLQLTDELNMKLMRKIRDASKSAVIAEGGVWEEHPAFTVIDRMLDDYARPGRLEGAGFYAYDEAGKRTGLWPELAAAFGADPDHGVPFEDMKERMLFIEAIETIKCVDEGVLESASDANIGSIFGIGFPAWTGGVLQYVNGYEGAAADGSALRGPAGFVQRARELAAAYGDRFTPPASLVELADRGGVYGDVPVLASA